MREIKKYWWNGNLRESFFLNEEGLIHGLDLEFSENEYLKSSCVFKNGDMHNVYISASEAYSFGYWYFTTYKNNFEHGPEIIFSY